MSKDPIENKNMDDKSEMQSLDSFLRPSEWKNYVGQEDIKKHLSILLRAAKERGQAPEHILLYGPPGLGKTTLAHIISKELGSNIRTLTGALIEKAGDIVSIVSSLEDGDVFFVDEIHRMSKAVEETLYPIMESGSINVIIGKGPSSRSVKIDMPPITIIGATTKIGLLSAPLRSRFSGGVLSLNYYSSEEISEIVKRSAKILDVKIDKGSIESIAKRSRKTPRTANYLLKRARDIAQIEKSDVNKDIVTKVFDLLGINETGLTKQDRRILEAIEKQFKGGPVGLSALAMVLSEDEKTLEDVYEPFLLQNALIERTQRGRVLTEKGKSLLGDF